MKMPFFMLFFVHFTTATSHEMTKSQFAVYNTFLADQSRLWNDLFKDYNPTISAIYTLHSSEWVNHTAIDHPPVLELNLTLQMLKLVDVVEVEEKVTFLFDYTATWTDTRLTWNPLEYGGISHIYVPHDKVWLPEITIADSHEVKFFTSDDAPKTAWVTFNGTVGFYTSTVSSVICELDVYKFPMDSHVCGVNILFHTYFNDEYKIVSLLEELPKPYSQLGNGEWEVTWIGVVAGESNGSIVAVQSFEARFSRNPGFYLALVMIPAFFINFLSIVALFINLENVSEKITVGLTNIMAMTFILVILAADLPKTKKIPLIAIYVIVGLVIIMVSIAVVFALPKIKKYRETRKGNNEKSAKTGRLAKLLGWIEVEYVFMVIFQVANLINFLIIFM